jgi:hypothetical protein
MYLTFSIQLTIKDNLLKQQYENNFSMIAQLDSLQRLKEV